MKLETKVGTFFVGTLITCGFLILRMEKLDLFSKSNHAGEFITEFDQVAGLNPNSPVRIAGVRVGEVRRVELRDGRAHVTFVLRSDVPIYEDAEASLSSIGILGEKYIELYQGHPGRSLARPNSVVKGLPGVSLENLMKTLEAVSNDVRGITASLNQTIGGEAGRQKLDEIVDNIRQLTGEFRAMAQENHGAITRTVGNVETISGELRDRLPKLSRQFEEVASNLNNLLNENRPEMKGITADVRKLTESFKGTSDNIKAITDKLKAGEGTLGKLLTDDATATKINTAVDNVIELTSGLKAMDLRLDMGAARWDRRGDTLSGLDMELAPRKDYWYAIGLHSTPDGKVQESLRTVTKIDPVTGLPSSILENARTVTSDQSFTVSAQFAKRLGQNLVLSAGIIEGKGGAAAEFRTADDRFRAGVMAYDFTKREGKDKPRVRLTTSYQLWKGLYLQAGVQDMANKDLRSVFYGGGIRWKDEDLKKLVGLAGAAK
jgi:phospholipid/cholesterol/gamma-HCH transport system substrate-binding protein